MTCNPLKKSHAPKTSARAPVQIFAHVMLTWHLIDDGVNAYGYTRGGFTKLVSAAPQLYDRM